MISGEYEPAHSLTEAFVTMLEESALKYVPASRCLSREQEIQSAKPDKKVVILEDHQLRVRTKGGELATDLSNEIRVRNALCVEAWQRTWRAWQPSD